MRVVLITFLALVYCQFVYSQNDVIGSGRALRFDGVDDYIDLGDVYDDFVLPITISVWIYVESS